MRQLAHQQHEVAKTLLALARAMEDESTVVVVGPEPWIGVDDAAEYLCCPRSRVYRLVSRHAIPFEKDGARLLFKRSQLDAWVQEGAAK